MKLALLVLLAALAPSAVQEPVRPPVQADEPDETLTPEQFAAAIRKRFESHKHLSKVLFVEDATYDPVRLYLHKPQVETADWQKKVALAHGPFLARIWESFRRRYVEPLKLERRPEVPLFAVCVLQTAGDFANYHAAVRSESYYRESAAFERRSRFTVTFHDGGSQVLLARRRYELAEFVAALLQAHYSGSGGEPAQLWLASGLGWYLASCGSPDPATLDNPSVDPWELQLVHDLVGDAKRRWIYLQRLPDIVDATSWSALEDRTSERARAAGVGLESYTLYQFWFRQCALWMHFLQEDPARARHFRSYLAYALQGRGSFDAFRKAFEGVDLEALERDFYRWVLKTQLARRPQDKLDLAVVDTLFDPPPGVKAAAKGASPEAKAAAKEAPANGAAPAAETAAPAKSFDPRSLAPARDDLTAEHGLVLQRIRRGDLDGARVQLDELAARAAGSDIERRLAREVDRLKRFVAIRDAWLAGLIASGAKQSVEIGGRKVVARFVAVEDGRIRLGENRQGLDSIALDEFSPPEIARELPKELLDSADGWIRNYAWVLEGDEERSKRGLAGSETHVVDLRADAEEWYPGVLKLGLAAQELADLAKAGVPADASSAAACLARIEAVRSTYGTLELVRGRFEALKQLTRLALEQAFTIEGLGSSLPGEFASIEDGRVRWKLDFSDASQANAFERITPFFEAFRAIIGPLQHPDPVLTVSDGSLRLAGAVGCRTTLPFEAPLTIEVAELHRDSPGPTQLELFACWEDENTYVSCVASGRLYSRHGPDHLDCKSGSEVGIVRDKLYRYALTVDGGKVTTRSNGSPSGECPSGRRKKGDIILFVHADAPILVDELTIEGGLDLDRARAAWIEAELVRRGF